MRELLKREQVVQFSWLVSMLGGRSQAGALCEALDGCAVLVQGCWVVRSELLHPGDEAKYLRRARDYVVSLTSVSTFCKGYRVDAVVTDYIATFAGVSCMTPVVCKKRIFQKVT